MNRFYTLVISPIEMIIDFFFAQVYRACHSEGAAIIIVSIIVQTLVLPLYDRADRIQEEERKKQKSMQYRLDRIRKAFTGDERMMMVNEYYRQQNYKPIYVLRSSVSLLLQIPFFTAAYNYLSTLTFLQGKSFGPIPDLGAPDGMLSIFGTTVNLLPVLMTAFNLISSVIYLRGSTLKEKLQQYGIALIFLILLYDRPAGLVLYWTMNNVYSLLKILVKKTGLSVRLLAVLLTNAVIMLLFASRISLSPFLICLFLLIHCLLLLGWLLRRDKALPWAAFVIGGSGLILLFLQRRRAPVYHALYLLATCGLLLLSGLIFKYRSWITALCRRILFGIPLPSLKEILLPELILTILIGCVIPLSVISDSPLDFLNENIDPAGLIGYSLVLYAGLFLIWLNVYFQLFEERAKKLTFLTVTVLAFTGLVNFFFFGKGSSLLSTYFVYDEDPVKPLRQIAVNSVILALLTTGILIFQSRIKKRIIPVCAILICGLLFLSGINLRTVRSAVRSVGTVRQETQNTQIIRLGKEGKNVIVFMLDRAVGAYFPFILEEMPELRDSFDGFTYYPNTASFGIVTNIAAPALFGGYEYTPVEINKRSGELLKDKHNEALRVLPKLFSDNGFDSVICNLPYANYSNTFDPAFFDGFPNTSAYNTGKMFPENEDLAKFYDARQKRNTVYFGLMKTLPLILQSRLYNNGSYHAIETNDFSWPFMKEYRIMEHLPDMTLITDEAGDHFFETDNDITHKPSILRTPGYTPDPSVSYSPDQYHAISANGKVLKMGNKTQVFHYQVNMAAMINLAKWFDYLRENGAYDNTRIIIVSDHAWDLRQTEDYTLISGISTESYNPLLLVKDFDAKGLRTDPSFMTNADVPTLAVSGIIPDPVNPFTGKPLNTDEKTAHDQLVTTSTNWRTGENYGTTFDTADGAWYSVHDNIFDKANWAAAEAPSE